MFEIVLHSFIYFLVFEKEENLSFHNILMK